MLNLDDSALLKEYVEHGSEEAFAALVARHVDKVYSIARRHTLHAHQAEEITQAVFVILARKAGQLNERVILSGWLCRTARLAAVSFLRGEIRRTRREQEAHMQGLLNESDSAVWPQIAPLLDAAMAGLSRADHDAVALRFFDGKSMKEIGAALGASEDAVKMRVNRAVEKLRAFFTRRGIVCSAAALTAAISANAVQAAPIGLAISVSTAAALSGTALATTATTTSSQVAALMTAPKGFVAGAAALAVVTGVTLYLIQQLTAAPPVRVGDAGLAQSQPAVRAASGEPLPVVLPNDSFLAILPDPRFLVELDPSVRRTTNSASAMHIKCLVAPTSAGAADFLRSLTSFVGRGLAASRIGVYAVTNGSPLIGQRVRVSGWMKTRAVGNWAGASLNVTKANGDGGPWDLMHDRPLHGTKDWQAVEFIIELPKGPCAITLAPTLYGPGEMWADGFQIDLAPPEASVTDVGRWTIWSQCPTDFSIAMDPGVTRNGRPTLRIAYVSSEPAEKYSFVWWGKHEYDLDVFRKYLGHRVRMSVWIKSEDVLPRGGLDFEPKDLKGKRLEKIVSADRVVGTRDWKEYSVVCDIPEETRDFQTAVFMYGDGKMWVDTNSFRWEIVDRPGSGPRLSPASWHVTQPGDLIFASSGNSRASEGVANVIDQNKQTKYLNWDSGRDGQEIGSFSPSGFAIQPAVGPTVVTGMGIQSANDAPDRDPDVVVLEGSNDLRLTDYESGTWTPITTISNIAAGFTGRYQSQEFFFSNPIPYRNYRWRVEATRITPNRCCMQVAEVWLMTSGPPN